MVCVVWCVAVHQYVLLGSAPIHVVGCIVHSYVILGVHSFASGGCS